jgi:hypothetical protein
MNNHDDDDQLHDHDQPEEPEARGQGDPDDFAGPDGGLGAPENADDEEGGDDDDALFDEDLDAPEAGAASSGPNGKAAGNGHAKDSPFGDDDSGDGWRADLPTAAQAKANPLSVVTPPALRALGRLYEENVSKCWGLIRQLVAAAHDPAEKRPALTEATLRKLVEKAARQWRKEQQQAEAKDEAGDGDKEQSQATQLISLARGVECAHTDMDVEVARYPVGGHREAARIGSDTFTKWLRFRFYQETKGAPRSEALKGAVEALKARALFDGPEVKTHLRVGYASDDIWYLDLGTPDHSVVEITAAGWRVLQQSPIWFLRSPSMLPLPEPQSGKNLDALRPFLNLRDGTTDLPEALTKRADYQKRRKEAVDNDDDFIISVGQLLCALNPVISERPNGAVHQWRKDPPRKLSVGPGS